jgi:hypothetical protein
MEKLNKKLQLNKEFIASLDKFEMTHVHGGNNGDDTNAGNGENDPERGATGWLSLAGIFFGPWGGAAAALVCCIHDQWEMSNVNTCDSSICYNSF